MPKIDIETAPTRFVDLIVGEGASLYRHRDGTPYDTTTMRSR